MSLHGAKLIEDGDATGPWVEWAGGSGTFAVVAGTWNGATVKLQLLGPDGSTALDVTDASFTADGYVNFELGVGKIRAFVSGSPANVFALVSYSAMFAYP